MKNSLLDMDPFLVTKILIGVLTATVIVAFVLLYCFAQHKYSIMFMCILIVGYIHEVLCVFYFEKFNRSTGSTEFTSFIFSVTVMPALSMVCFLLFGAITSASFSVKRSFSKLLCFIYIFIALVFIVIWINSFCSCLTLEISYETNNNCKKDMMHTNNTAYKVCIWKFWIHNLKSKDDRQNIALYCFEAMNSKISGYFLSYLLIYIPAPAIIYYKTATLSEWWSSPSMETCPICCFNMYLYNHIVALFFIINWCVGPIVFLVFATGMYFYHQPIYFNSTVMASTTTIYILPLIYILKFYIFSKRDSKMDNECQYHDSVIKNCEQN